MRSSPSRGEPRPSRLDVVTHSVPSGAAATVRMRPSPVSIRAGLPTEAPCSGIFHTHWPCSAPTYNVVPMIAAPDGEASDVAHVTFGLVNLPPCVEPTPSTIGHP